MKYYIIAGEASGDLHGSNLVKELKRQDPAASFRGFGGDKMAAAGVELVRHYRDLAFMGFVEVLMNLRTILRNLSFCKKDIVDWKPDALILVDYPGFNLRIAKWARKQGLRIIYYISPQVWAWKEGRVRSMKQCIDKMLVILPFEKDYYKNKWNWEVEYVGHPLVEEVEEFRVRSREPGALPAVALAEEGRESGEAVQPAEPSDAELQIANSELNIIALLPGSRKQEILKKLPVMLEVSRSFPAYRFVVAKAPGVDESFYDALLAPYPNVSYVSGQTYSLLNRSVAALVTSGTATLETALFGVPEVVCYKGSWLSYQIGRRVVKVKFISLVNLIMDRLVVKELIQDALNRDNLERELKCLLEDDDRRAALAADYKALWDILGSGGHASAKAAASIHRFLSQ